MELIYRREFPVSQEYLDPSGAITPAAILYLSQEAAGGHCKTLGTDWDTLQKKGLFWALIRTQVQIHADLQGLESVTVETWPMPTTRVAYPRCTVGYDPEGKPLFTSISLWVLMDTRTRAMVLPDKSGIRVDGIIRGTEPELPKTFPKLQPECLVFRTVGLSELDQNGHMNNTKYMVWVMDLLSEAFRENHPVKSFGLCYMAEVLKDQQIRLGYTLTDGLLTVDAHREKTDDPGKTDRVFCAKVEF